MPSLTKDEILKFPGSDVELSGVEWLEDGSLRLTLVMPGAEKRVARLTGSFATEVRMDLHFRESTGGRPMTWDTTFAEIPGSGWHVLLDFAGAPDGAIEFDCAELQIEYVETPVA
jgi:hypothetical protein